MEEGKKSKLGFCGSDERLNGGNLDWSKMRMTDSWVARQESKLHLVEEGMNLSIPTLICLNLFLTVKRREIFSSTLFRAL